MLTATDLELAIQCSLPAAVAEQGRLTVPARLLSDLVAQLPSGDVTLAADERNVAVVTCEQSQYRLLGLPPEEFPPLPEVKSEVAFQIRQNALHAMIRFVTVAASTDDTRPILTGVRTVLQGNTLQMVATDTHRLAVCSNTVEGAQGEGSVIVPGRALTEVLRALQADREEPVQVRLDANQVSFVTESVTLVSRLIAGHYPSHERHIPSTWSARLLIPVAPFEQVLRRAALVAREDGNRVTLRTEGESLLVTARAGALGEAYESLEVAREGSDFEMGISCRYLLDALAVWESEGIYFETTGQALAPAVLRPVEAADTVMVIAPVRLQ
jgi:DNA polymerase-3 subunit beta